MVGAEEYFNAICSIRSLIHPARSLIVELLNPEAYTTNLAHIFSD